MPAQRHIPISERHNVRIRSTRACAPCRKRKTKCDGTEPCSACVGYGYECSYAKLAPRGPPSSTSPMTSHSSPGNVIHSAKPESAPASEIQRPHTPFMAQETIVPDGCTDAQLYQSIKTRFTSAYSAIAWPKRLGIVLGLPNPPRLNAFGWTAGTRIEQDHIPPNRITQMVTLDDMKRYGSIYFKEVQPFFGMFDYDLWEARTSDFWSSQAKGTDFEACMCMVFALGSYFSGTLSSPSEAQVLEHGRTLLDLSTAHPPAMVSVKHVAAWNLRAIYLRLTTRPHLSWIASCTAVHLAESIGLHREINEISMPRQVSDLEVDLRRRTFWVTLSLNHYFAAEYGRSRVIIDSISCRRLEPRDGDLTFETVAILESVPEQRYMGTTAEILGALSKAINLPSKSPFLALLRADACFCIYRMLCALYSKLSKEIIPRVLEVIRVAMDAVLFLSSINHPWWNIVGTPFQAICILISINASESFCMIPSVMQTLRNVTTTYNSHISDEALRTARMLVQGARDKRKGELDSLDQGLAVVQDLGQTPDYDLLQPLNEFGWPAGNSLGFPDFLDLTNYYSQDGSFPGL